MKCMQAVLMCLLLAPLAGCASDPSPWVELKGTRFKVEVVDDDASRARGLMFRDSLADDAGMLFVFPQQEPLAFWMKNTKIPLDILYFDDALKLVSMVSAPPCTTPQCPNYPSEGPARYTLELKAGTARRLGAKRGDALTLAPDIDTTSAR